MASSLSNIINNEIQTNRDFYNSFFEGLNPSKQRELASTDSKVAVIADMVFAKITTKYPDIDEEKLMNNIKKEIKNEFTNPFTRFIRFVRSKNSTPSESASSYNLKEMEKLKRIIDKFNSGNKLSSKENLEFTKYLCSILTNLKSKLTAGQILSEPEKADFKLASSITLNRLKQLKKLPSLSRFESKELDHLETYRPKNIGPYVPKKQFPDESATIQVDAKNKKESMLMLEEILIETKETTEENKKNALPTLEEAHPDYNAKADVHLKGTAKKVTWSASVDDAAAKKRTNTPAAKANHHSLHYYGNVGMF